MPSHKLLLERLLALIKSRDGPERVQELEGKLRSAVDEAMSREILLQLLTTERWYRRWVYLLWYPSYLVPYLFRVRKKKDTGTP